MTDSTIEKEAEKLENVHTSAVLRKLLVKVNADHFTLDWLLGHLPERSFGVILLFLSLIALMPVISFPAHIVVLILTFQIIFGYEKPSLPARLMRLKLPSKYLFRLKRRAIPILEILEIAVRPRWTGLLTQTRYLARFVVVALTLAAILVPLPFANVPPSILTILIALAYIEHDGMLLAVAYLLSFLGVLLMMWVI